MSTFTFEARSRDGFDTQRKSPYRLRELSSKIPKPIHYDS